MSQYLDPQLLLIPLISGLIGWGTNALAIKMLFAPLTRRGIGLLSWQGVLPAHAQRMATICVELMTTRLLNVPNLFRRIEPERVAELLAPGIERHAEAVVEEVLQTRYPRLWKAMPDGIRQRARLRLKNEIPVVVKKLMGELRADLDSYLDVKGLVVGAFVRNRALLNEFFWRCGAAEFRFIARSGLIFGCLFGLPVAVVWMVFQPGWLLPVTGLLVGWATNWLALKMVFEPLEPKRLGPFQWQGLFLKRQAEVSEAYGAFFSERILHPKALVDAVIEGPASDRIVELIQRYVGEAVDEASGPARHLVSLTLGSEEWQALRRSVSDGISSRIPAELDRVQDYAGEALELDQELARNLRELPPVDFEQVLRPVFREDEATLIAVGAILGGVAGLLQMLALGAV
ncbi:MAG: DUF445 domain-containing protein [Myxococcales bacterium]|nr:DUF445 domain-containing protein [Myxococcales bacterium]